MEMHSTTLKKSLLTIAIAGLTVVSVEPATAGADPGRPPLPAVDSFYAQPSDLAQRKMGDIVASHPILVRDMPTRTEFRSWQMKYVSQDTKGKPWTTMAVVLQPTQGGSADKLMAYLPWIDVLDSRCNPSYQLRTDYAYMAASGMVGEMGNIAKALDEGWTVVVPDYLGPDNQFAAGYVEGRNTLDGIRAALQLPEAGLASDTPVTMFGYSGGSRGAEFGAELAPTYAPEINLVGTAAGGLPTDMAATARFINGGPFSAINYMAAYGLDRAYPELGIGAKFTDADLARHVTGICQAEALVTYPFSTVQDHTADRVWPLEDAAINDVLDGLKAGSYGTPQSPLYLFTADNDEIAITENTDRLVDDYRSRGVPVTYVKHPGTEHVTAESAGSGQAFEWLAARVPGA